jgi:RNA polymerase sigma factor (sigma-70 family)
MNCFASSGKSSERVTPLGCLRTAITARRTDYEQTEGRRHLLACLDLVGPEKKDVLLQAYYYGMTREEIAQRIGRPVSTIKTWLRRSLAELKGYLGE